MQQPGYMLKRHELRSSNNRGEIIRYNPPLVTHEKRMYIVRDDGEIYGDGGPKAMADLGIIIHLPEQPPTDKTWSSLGVKAFAKGIHPDPLKVFNRLVEVINEFIDFDHSLSDQQTMAETIACFILSTWFLDAFNVIGFLWPNGDRGSGKTHLLILTAEMAYLGQVILAGGSYASLRDLADYGATLAFDDAENFANYKTSDPDKRALLLAGNHRGATVTLKELGPDKKWHTRYINAILSPIIFSH